MAIYSLSHSSIGRTTHAAGTAGAHVMYITRQLAARQVWDEVKKKIELRVQELKQRWDRMAEYSRKLVDLFNSKAQNLAHGQVMKLYPELAKKLSHHRELEMEKRGREIDKELEKKREMKLEMGITRGLGRKM